MKNAFKNYRYATINVGTYGEKEEEIIDIMKERKIDLLGMAEMRMRGSEDGRELGDGFVLMYSGVREGIRKHGVGIIVGPRLSPCIQRVKSINERLMMCILKIGRIKYRIFQVYAPQQGHSEEEKDRFMELMEEEVGMEEEGEKCVMMGDFNARVGKRREEVERVLGLWGEETRNMEGERLVDFCIRNDLKIMNTFFKHRESHIFTRYRWNQGTQQFDQKSVIDYMIVSDKRMVRNVKVIPGVSLDADHRLVVADMKMRGEGRVNEQKRAVIKVEKLAEQEERRKYEQEMQETLRNREGNEEDLQEVIKEVAERTLGKRWVGGTKKRHTPWWNEEVKNAIKEKTAKMRKWLKRRTAEAREEYVQARNEAERIKRRAKKAETERMAREITRDASEGKKKLFKMAKAYRKPKSVIKNIKDGNGVILVRPEERNDRWTEYYEDLLNVEYREQEGEIEDQTREEEEEEHGEITVEEYEEAIKSMKRGKAPGEDGVAVELVVEGGEELRERVISLMNKCWREGKVPERWGKAIILPIYKGKGDAGNCNNYRGISLIDHLAKIYERILERRLREKVEPKLGEEQHGYRRGRGTTDLLFTLRMVTEKMLEYGKSFFVAFIDLQKAFDSVPRKKLWRAMERNYGVKGRLKKAIESMYEKCSCNVRTEGENDRWFEVKTGVKQGSVLSPLLFILYLDVVIKKVKERLEDFDGDIMAYADDLACWSENEEKIREVVELFAEELEDAGMKMNVQKTEILTVTGGNEEGLRMMVGGEEVKAASTCNYLGGCFNRGGGSGGEITQRMEKYGLVMKALYPMMKDKNIGIEVKKVIYNSILTPTLLYGAETWTTTRREESRIQAAEMRVLRTMIGKSRRDRIRNEVIRETVGVKKMILKMDVGRLRWWGHLERMEPERMPRRRWEWTPEGRRPRGRPKKRWAESVEDSLKRCQLPTMRMLRRRGVVQERDVWGKTLARLTG